MSARKFYWQLPENIVPASKITAAMVRLAAAHVEHRGKAKPDGSIEILFCRKTDLTRAINVLSSVTDEFVLDQS